MFAKTFDATETCLSTKKCAIRLSAWYIYFIYLHWFSFYFINYSIYISNMTAEKLYELSKSRFISVSEFKGKQFVNIREYYEQDGELKPGRKGISLTKEQWEKVKEHTDKIDECFN
ncbi:putative RNA polymerase II transcriptional coactivator [Intoshia linei]|uniref:Putative RNA polymerase II transcriptional coactivator n=1 Tax=Intoshia linei TaxID=1819745 RepID=A0A177B6J9_9BILA|nr:putative RNA polymerase II transcriptional coactivator [Intoshia linei]